jgi:hypothetical protein
MSGSANTRKRLQSHGLGSSLTSYATIESMAFGGTRSWLGTICTISMLGLGAACGANGAPVAVDAAALETGAGDVGGVVSLPLPGAGDVGGVVSLPPPVDCGSPPSDAIIVDGPACGSLPDYPCAGNFGNIQESASFGLDQVIRSGGCWEEEFSLSAWVADGCVVALDGYPQRVVACALNILPGHRFDCAEGLSCMGTGYSTLAPLVP